MPSTHVLEAHAPVEAAQRPRSLRLIWQDEGSRQFVHVATLSQVEAENFVFRYEKGAEHENFATLAEFPELDRVYTVNSLPAFFSNRAMSPRRASYPQYCSWLGLSEVPTPMEILARSGGGRATDTFHVVDDFRPVDGQVEGFFLASGVRHKASDNALSNLCEDERLLLVPEPDNQVNPQAILLSAASGELVGYVPDWLLDDVYGWGLANTIVRVAQVNAEAPAHLRLLCRIKANLSQS